MNEQAEIVIRELEALGADGCRYEPRTGHSRVYYKWRGREQFYVVGNSTSDWRAQRNAVADIRRILGVRPQKKKSPVRKRRKPVQTEVVEWPDITVRPDPFEALADHPALQDDRTSSERFWWPILRMDWP